jgi:opacity protein-like surface antigen
MKNLLLSALAAIFLVSSAQAAVTGDCVTIQASGTISGAGATNSSILALNPKWKFHKFVAKATPGGGTLPTLDVKIQNCETSVGTCRDSAVSFTQCTTGSCYAGDGVEDFDTASHIGFDRYIRAVITAGGTTPVYTGVEVKVCNAL